jgi:trehalose/maltose transport system permease protein
LGDTGGPGHAEGDAGHQRATERLVAVADRRHPVPVGESMTPAKVVDGGGRRQAERPRHRRANRLVLDEARTGYLMVAPAFLLVAAVAFFPVLYSLWLSMRSSTIDDAGDWVALDNYRQLLDDPSFREAVVNTVVFTVVSVSLELVLAVSIALGLNQTFRGRGAIRTAALLPWAFPVVVSTLMWRLMLQDDVGIVTHVAQSAGLADGPVLSDQTSLLVAATLIDVWKETPFMALLVLAGLQTIPTELMEAARVDGANAMQRLFKITLPLVRPAILVALLFRTLQAWGVYDLFYVLSHTRLESLSTYVYKGVRVSQLGFATGTAAATLTFLGALAIALIFIRQLGVRTMAREV